MWLLHVKRKTNKSQVCRPLQMREQPLEPARPKGRPTDAAHECSLKLLPLAFAIT